MSHSSYCVSNMVCDCANLPAMTDHAQPTVDTHAMEYLDAFAKGRRAGLEEAAKLIEEYKVTEGESLGDAMNEYLDSVAADIRAKTKEAT